MNAFSQLFLAVLLGGTALQLWLALRHARHVARHADTVPAAFADRIDLDQHRRAARYTLAKLRLEYLALPFGALVLLAWTLGGGLAALDTWLARWDWPALWQGTALLLLVVLIGAALELPLTLWRTFGIEQRFGFNRTTPRRFVADLALQTLLALALGGPLLVVVLWLMAEAGARWWLYAWAVWIAFTLAVTWAYPNWIAPLFNKFKPLADAALRQRLEALLQRCGFRSDGMFVMDGSRRSSHGNAYFTGFGRNKRIVFFDTLLQGLADAEVEAVLAHELGHFKKHHVLKHLLLSATVSLGGLALLGWLAQQPWFYAGLGVGRQTPALALVLFLLAAPVFSVFVSPLLAALSRRHEFEADDFAAAHTGAAPLISGLVKMYRDNASTLTPDPWYSAFHHSHPPAPVRIAHLSSKLEP
jgi:STE24 endopeptidase